jgi:hypothetical protein
MAQETERGRRRWGFGAAIGALCAASLVAGAAPCGAEDVDAPPDPPEPEHACTPPRELAPTFYAALETDAYAGLREIVEEVLAVCTFGAEVVPCNHPRAEPPAAAVLLAGIFTTLGDFAGDPPEVSGRALPGEPGYCAEPGAEPSPPNRLCTVTRSIDRLIAQRTETGAIVLVAAFDHLQPLIADLLRYVDGSLEGYAGGDHYGDLEILRRMVRRCDDEAVVDLLSGVIDFIHPPRGQEILAEVVALLDNPDAEGFLAGLDVDDDVGRAGFKALVRIILDQLQRNEFHPSELDDLLEDLVYPLVRSSFPDNELEGDIRRLMVHVNDALHPDRQPNILAPLRKVVDCATASDPDEVLVGAVYDLFFQADIVGLDELLLTISALLDIDPDGTVLRTADLLIRTLAAQPDVRDAFKDLLRVLLDAPHARIVFPVIIDMLESDVVGEVVALADQLLTGCGGRAAVLP